MKGTMAEALGFRLWVPRKGSISGFYRAYVGGSYKGFYLRVLQGLRRGSFVRSLGFLGLGYTGFRFEGAGRSFGAV